MTGSLPRKLKNGRSRRPGLRSAKAGQAAVEGVRQRTE